MLYVQISLVSWVFHSGGFKQLANKVYLQYVSSRISRTFVSYWLATTKDSTTAAGVDHHMVTGNVDGLWDPSASPAFRSTRRKFRATPYAASGYWGHVIHLTKEVQPYDFSPVASCVCAHLDSGTMSNSVISVISRFLEEYTTTTPNKLKVVDAYLLYILLTGALQFLYCLLVGTFPFNSFLSGFISCVGAFILAGEFNNRYFLSQTNVKISFEAFLKLRNAAHKTEPVCIAASMSS